MRSVCAAVFRRADSSWSTRASARDAGAVFIKTRCDTRSGWRIAYAIATWPPHECPSTTTDSTPNQSRHPVEVVDLRGHRDAVGALPGERSAVPSLVVVDEAERAGQAIQLGQQVLVVEVGSTVHDHDRQTRGRPRGRTAAVDASQVPLVGDGLVPLARPWRTFRLPDSAPSARLRCTAYHSRQHSGRGVGKARQERESSGSHVSDLLHVDAGGIGCLVGVVPSPRVRGCRPRTSPTSRASERPSRSGRDVRCSERSVDQVRWPSSSGARRFRIVG